MNARDGPYPPTHHARFKLALYRLSSDGLRNLSFGSWCDIQIWQKLGSVMLAGTERNTSLTLFASSKVSAWEVMPTPSGSSGDSCISHPYHNISERAGVLPVVCRQILFKSSTPTDVMSFELQVPLSLIQKSRTAWGNSIADWDLRVLAKDCWSSLGRGGGEDAGA